MLESLSHRIWVVLVCAVLGGLIAGLVFANMPLKYKASVNVIVEPGPYTTTNEHEVLDNADRMAAIYSHMIVQPEVLRAAIDALGLSTKPEALAAKVTAEPVKDKHLVQVSVVDSPPEQAANQAYAIAQAFVNYKKNLQSQDYVGLLADNQKKLDSLAGLTQQARDQIDALAAKRTLELARLSDLTEKAIQQKSDYQLLIKNQEDLQLKLKQLEKHLLLVSRTQPAPAALLLPTGTVTATLQVNPEPVTAGDSYSNAVAGEMLVSTYAQELASKQIVEAALQKIGLQVRYTDVLNNIIVKPVPGTTSINLMISGRSLPEAARLADTLAAEFIDQTKAKYQTQYEEQLADIENQMKKKSAEIGQAEAEINYLNTSIKDSRTEISRLENLLTTYEADRAALSQNLDQIRLEMDRDLEVSLVVEPARLEMNSILSMIMFILLACLAGAMVGVVLVIAIHLIGARKRSPAGINA